MLSGQFLRKGVNLRRRWRSGLDLWGGADRRWRFGMFSRWVFNEPRMSGRKRRKVGVHQARAYSGFVCTEDIMGALLKRLLREMGWLLTTPLLGQPCQEGLRGDGQDSHCPLPDQLL